MTDRPSKVWEPYSKMVRMQEEDWAVLESVYNDYRNRHRTKNLIILMLIIQSPRQQTNRPAQHHPVKSRPAWNSRIFLKSTMPRGADPETLPSITLGPEFPIGQYSSHYQRNQTKREKVRLKGVSDGRAVLPRQEPEIDEGNVPD